MHQLDVFYMAQMLAITLLVQVERSAGCVFLCVQAITFDLDDL